MICEECRLGRLQLIQTPYMSDYQGYIFLAANVPAIICDFCGHMTYDPLYMEKLKRLLDTSELKDQGAEKAGRQSARPWRASWTRARRSG